MIDYVLDLIIITFFVVVGCIASIVCSVQLSHFIKDMKRLDASIKHWEKLKAALDEEERRHVLPYD